MPAAPSALPGTRVNVIGSTGAGKTTSARRLADRLGLRCIELDAVFWKPNWGETPDEEFLPLVDQATQGDGWVLDGNYSRTRPISWPRLDTIVWLDYRFSRVFWQLLRRTVRRSASREELWEGCQERFSKSFCSKDSILLFCIKTYRKRRRNYRALLQRPEHAHLRVFRFRSPRAFGKWLESLPLPGDKGVW